MIRVLYKIVNGDKRDFSLKTQIINKITYLTRISIKKIIDEIKKIPAYKDRDTEYLIRNALYFKNSYIEFLTTVTFITTNYTLITPICRHF